MLESNTTEGHTDTVSVSFILIARASFGGKSWGPDVDDEEDDDDEDLLEGGDDEHAKGDDDGGQRIF